MQYASYTLTSHKVCNLLDGRYSSARLALCRVRAVGDRIGKWLSDHTLMIACDQILGRASRRIGRKLTAVAKLNNTTERRLT